MRRKNNPKTVVAPTKFTLAQVQALNPVFEDPNPEDGIEEFPLINFTNADGKDITIEVDDDKQMAKYFEADAIAHIRSQQPN